MYRQILKQYFGYDDFRGIQREIIEDIGSGRDTLGLMPTGGGKSITFQVPALSMPGVCIVISPLIALMKDQVQHLRERGIIAAAIHSGLTHKEIIATLENCILGNTKLLYISPERISTQIFKTKLAHMQVSFITVDEAHCISQWGYDFRPAYLQIAEIRRLKPEAPILALTATATPKVVKDIQEKLLFKQENVHQMSFERKNVAYVVRYTEDKDSELLHILRSVPGSAIIYTRSRQGTKDTSKFLTNNGISSTFFHAGLDHSVKDQRQMAWQKGETRVIVATNAFGMGIDKPDVRLVIHTDSPDSIESYFQEAGRAGRDGKRSWAVLLYGHNDHHHLQARIPATYPTKEYIRNIYEHLAYFYQIAEGFGQGETHTFDIAKFCYAYRFFPVQVESSLRILHNAGYIEYETEPDSQSRLVFMLQRTELYKLKELSPNEEAVITQILRHYGGVFNDYVNISEDYIATHAQIEKDLVHLILKSLSKRRIIHYIPKRKMPYICYTRDREDKDRLVFPPQIYEQRKKQMEQRIKSMTTYARNNRCCRSRQLLQYFGEEQEHDCGACDVCQEKKGNTTKAQKATAEQAILDLLADKQRHHVTELNTILLPRPQMAEALRNLIYEQEIRVDANWLYIK